MNCAEDENDGTAMSVCDSFMACQDDTVWKQIQIVDNVMYVSYFKLHDDLSNPLELYTQDIENDCYYYMDMTMADGLFEVIENSQTKFGVRITGDENDVTEWDLSMDDGRLKIDIRNYEDNVMYESFQVLLEKSIVDVNQLVICEDN